MDSRLELSAYAWKRRAISDTNALPAEPEGIRKTSRLQWMTSSYALDIIAQKSTPSRGPH